MPTAHLPELRGPQKASKRTCLGRTGAFNDSAAHLHKNPPVNYTNDTDSAPPFFDSSKRLCTTVREFLAAFVRLEAVQEDRFLSPEELAARQAVVRAINKLEDHARWMEAELGV